MYIFEVVINQQEVEKRKVSFIRCRTDTKKQLDNRSAREISGEWIFSD